MSADYIAGVLGVLRKIKATQHLGPQHSTLTYLTEWSGATEPYVALAMAMAIQEQLRGAQSIIEASSLSDEAKSGLLVTITGLTNAFSLAGLNGAQSQFLPSIDPAITNFAIIASVASKADTDSLKDTLSDLTKEIDELAERVKIAEIDPMLRETIVRHLFILTAMLRNVEAVGIDAAVSAYFELLVRVRRAEKFSSEDSKKAMSGVWPKINALGEKLGKISGLLETGMKLVSYAEKLPGLLQHFQN